MGLDILGLKGHGRPRKTYLNWIRTDKRACRLDYLDPPKRLAWRSGLRKCNCLLPTPILGTPQQLKNTPRIGLIYLDGMVTFQISFHAPTRSWVLIYLDLRAMGDQERLTWIESELTRGLAALIIRIHRKGLPGGLVLESLAACCLSQFKGPHNSWKNTNDWLFTWKNPLSI